MQGLTGQSRRTWPTAPQPRRPLESQQCMYMFLFNSIVFQNTYFGRKYFGQNRSGYKEFGYQMNLRQIFNESHNPASAPAHPLPPPAHTPPPAPNISSSRAHANDVQGGAVHAVRGASAYGPHPTNQLKRTSTLPLAHQQSKDMHKKRQADRLT